MKLSRRRFLHLAAGAAALPSGSRIARAQAYPNRPVRLLVGFSAGGTTDIAARLIAQWLTERLRATGCSREPAGRERESGSRSGRALAARRLHAARGNR